MKTIPLATMLDFKDIPSGRKLTKFIGVDVSHGFDYTAKIHGLIDETGNVFITNVETKKKEEAVLKSPQFEPEPQAHYEPLECAEEDRPHYGKKHSNKRSSY